MCGLLQNFPRFFHGICRASRTKKQLRYIKPPFYQLMLMLSSFVVLKGLKAEFCSWVFRPGRLTWSDSLLKRKSLLFFWKSLWGLHVESYRRDRFKAKKCGRVGLCMFDHESGESLVKVRIPHCIKLARVLLHDGQSHHSNNLMSRYLILIYIFFTFTLLGNWKYINQ